MKKFCLFFFLIILAIGVLFAETEVRTGFYGGYGNAAAAGWCLQAGYLSPAETGLRWGLLFDMGMGYRYGSIPIKSYTVGSWEMYYEINPFDYNLGIITDFYYLPFMGLSLGGGITAGAGDFINGGLSTWLAPYARAEIPFLLKYVQLGLSFDYIFWKDNSLPAGIKVLPGYRFSFNLRFRNEAAAVFMRFFTWWFGG